MPLPAGPSQGPATFPRFERLRQRREFEALYREGRKLERPLLLLFWRPGAGARRIGLAVSPKIGGAVQRNRIKRHLREAYRLEKTLLPPGTEVAIIARPKIAEETFQVIRQEVARGFAALARRSGESGRAKC